MPGLTEPQTLYPHPMVPRRTNLIVNPSFDNDTSAWQGFGVAGVADSNWAVPYGGGKSSKQAGTTGGSGYQEVSMYYNGGVAPSLGARIVPGRTYTVSAYINVVSATNLAPITPSAFLRWYDINGSTISQTSTYATTGVLGVQRVAHTDTAPANAVWCQPIILMTGTADPSVWNLTYDWRVDAVLLEESLSAGIYFDGSSPGAWWDGDAAASTSGTAHQPHRRNLHTNPRFGNGMTDWIDGGGPTYATKAAVSSGGYDGAGCGQITIVDKAGLDSGGGANYDHFATFHTYFNLIGNRQGPVNVGAWLKAPAGRIIGISAYRVFEGDLYPWSPGYPSDGTALSRNNYVTATATGDWQWVSAPLEAYTGTAHGSRMHCRFGFEGGGGGLVNGDVCSVDWGLIEQNSTGDYFDGQMPGVIWEGTAHQSASHTSVISFQDITGAAETELRLPNAGFTVSGDRAAHLLDLSMQFGPDLSRSPYLTARGQSDDFNRADEGPPLSADYGWTQSVYDGGGHHTKLVNQQLTIHETPAGTNYAFAGRQTAIPAPAACGFTIVSLPSTFDWYVDFCDHPDGGDGAGGGTKNFMEFSFWNRPEWIDNVTYFQAKYVSFYGRANNLQLGGPAGLGWKETPATLFPQSGDQVAFTYENNMQRTWLRRPGANQWGLMGYREFAHSKHSFNAMPLFCVMYFSNYAGADPTILDDFWFSAI